MRVTKSSKNDLKVTITVKRLAVEFPWVGVGTFQDGAALDLTFQKGRTTYTTKFTVSRNGTTLYGPLPAGFKLPKIGKGVEVKVVKVDR